MNTQITRKSAIAVIIVFAVTAIAAYLQYAYRIEILAAPNFRIVGQYYLIASAIVSFVLLKQMPGKGVDNFGGSVLAAILFGWLIWPFAAVAVYNARKTA